MKKELIVQRDPKSPVSEVFRTLRTNIQFMNSQKGLKTLLVTSTMPGEGKSWVTANLAATFAQAGKRVILIDADMRKGRQFNIFGVRPKPGLSNYLSNIDETGRENKSGISHYVQETEIDNLFLIPAGNVPPNPSELLVSEKMMEMIMELKEVCDLVIFDGTPSTLVTDSIILSRFVDSTIIVAEYKSTKMEDLNRIKKDILNVGGHIAGIVLNKIPASAKKYDSTYYYGNTTSLRATNSYSNGSKRERAEEILKQNTRKIDISDKTIDTNIKTNAENCNVKTEISTEDMLKQVNSYLEKERSKLQNMKGDKND